MASTNEKTALFIDGPNLYFTAKNLGFDIDFHRLLAEFSRRGPVLRAYYYATIIEDPEYHSIRPLIDWLDYNGFAVVARTMKDNDAGDGRRKFKGQIGVDLVVDALEIAQHIRSMVLFSGVGDLCPLVEAVQRKGVHVTVVSSLRTKRPMIADELRRQANTFLELDDLKGLIGRTARSLRAV
jgi:uncharacterized LabA/DUF88 family protein